MTETGRALWSWLERESSEISGADMDAQTFKGLIGKELKSRGFQGGGSLFRRDVTGVTIVIRIQKSAHSNAFYLNVGYILPQLASGKTTFRDVDGDVRARFSLPKGGKRTDLFVPEELDEVGLRDIIQENWTDLIDPVASLNDLALLLQRKPILRYQTTVAAREFLGIA